MRILLVEDNRNLVEGLRHNLELDGHRVDAAYTGTQALEHLRTGAWDLLILDLMIPRPDGLQVLRTIRENGNEVPVIILTARGEEADKVRGLRLGADDYVTKPFGLMELLARVEAMRRRLRMSGGNTRAPMRRGGIVSPVDVGDLRIDPATHLVTRRGLPVVLRPKEYDLLIALIRRDGGIATRVELLEEVWGYGPDVMSRTVDTHIGQLRQKLEDDPDDPHLILTVRKTGYRLAG